MTTVVGLFWRDEDVYEPLLARAKQRQSNDEPVVTAVLFYSPTCPHCHQVITEVLVPMVNEYGDQLQIAGIDTSQVGGAQLYQAAIERYQIPPERHGVPTLVVGDVVLVGGREIPERFPALFEEGLAAGGIDWPDIPGLAEMLSAAEAEPTTTPTPRATATAIVITATTPPVTLTPLPSPTAVPQTNPTPVPSFTAVPAAGLLTIGEDAIPPGEVQESQADPLGFTLAGVVSVGMVVAGGYAALRLRLAGQRLFQLDRNPIARARTRAIPLFVLLGLGVATYLAYVEVRHVEAVCGPVGECNVVQSSDYAVMLGIPVAVWGVLNYLAIGALWAGQRQLPGRWANLSALGLLGLTLFGTPLFHLSDLSRTLCHSCHLCLVSQLGDDHHVIDASGRGSHHRRPVRGRERASLTTPPILTAIPARTAQQRRAFYSSLHFPHLFIIPSQVCGILASNSQPRQACRRAPCPS